MKYEKGRNRMPIYVYEPTIYSIDEQVNDCCYFEILQNMSEKALTQCPTCGHAIHRAVTSFYVKEVNMQKEQSSQQMQSSNSSSAAKNAARLAARHICGGGCRH